MTWSFDSRTGGLGQIPGLTRCMCACMCVCSRVRVCESLFMGTRRNQDRGSLESLQMATDGKQSLTWLLD